MTDRPTGPSLDPEPPAEAVGARTWFRAIAAALAMQFGALVVFVASAALVILAMFDAYTSRSQSTPGYAALSAPLALTALGIWIWSGAVARRITGRRLAWLVLLAGPSLYGGLWLLSAAS